MDQSEYKTFMDVLQFFSEKYFQMKYCSVSASCHSHIGYNSRLKLAHDMHKIYDRNKKCFSLLFLLGKQDHSYLVDLPYGGLVILGSDGSLNGPVPALLTAATWNSYSLPSIRSFTFSVVSDTGSLFTFVHLVEVFSLRSRM